MVDFVMRRYGEGEMALSHTMTKRFLLVLLIISFHVRKSFMENVNFCNLCLKMYMEKKKSVGPRYFWNLKSSISFTVGQMLSRAKNSF